MEYDRTEVSLFQQFVATSQLYWSLEVEEQVINVVVDKWPIAPSSYEYLSLSSSSSSSSKMKGGCVTGVDSDEDDACHLILACYPFGYSRHLRAPSRLGDAGRCGNVRRDGLHIGSYWDAVIRAHVKCVRKRIKIKKLFLFNY